jgi:hypothetical protein
VRSNERIVLRRRLRHKAGTDQAVRQQIGQPNGVSDIGLAARHVLDVRRIGPDQRDVAVGEDMPDRLPVDPGRLYSDVRATVLGQPAGQRQQTGRGRIECANIRCSRTSGGDTNGGDHAVFVHIQTSTARIENVHDPLLVTVPPTQDIPDEKL